MKLSFQHYYFRWSKNLALLFVLFIVLMTLARSAFAFYFGEKQSLTADLSDLRSAFLLGLRFDLMPLAYINAVPFIVLNFAYLLPGKLTIKISRFFITTFLCTGYFSLIWLYVCDYGFYSYYQEHLNVLFFGLFEDDTIALMVSIWKNYNLPLWLFIIFIIHYVFLRFVRFLFSPYEFDLKVKRFDWKMPIIFILGCTVLSFFARGNFTRLPLSIEDAHISNNQFINELSINGPLSLNRAIKIRKVYGNRNYDFLHKNGYESWIQAYEDAFSKSPKTTDFKKSLKARVPVNPTVEDRPPHVVMVVMESFGSYWNEYDGSDFNLLGELKQHFQKGLLFKNFLPGDNGTIGSIVSVAVSQVNRPGARFLSESEFKDVSLASAGHLPYKYKGYDTHFIYGGKLGWRDLGKYLRVQGYDHLWGADEVKEAMPELNNLEERELGNEWGIFDEYLYAFLEEQLRTATRPQFFLVLTTSNHPPFEYPSSYSPLKLELSPEIVERLTVSKELAMKRFLGIQYANQKMGQFLSKIKSSSLSENVVVALTGDHSFWIAKGVGLDEEFKRYAVPFFISVPDKLRPRHVDLKRFGSHEDIFPTLYSLTLSGIEYVKTGEDMLTEESIAINSYGPVANKLGVYHNEKFWKWKDLEKQILEPAEETPELLRLKNHAAGLISITDLFLKEEKKNMPLGGENGRR